MRKNNLENYPSTGRRTAKRMFTNEMNLIRGIIPQHMFDEIAKNGDTAQKELALKHMMVSEKIRGRREAFGEFYVAASAGVKCLNTYDAKNGQDLPGEPVNDPGNSNDPAVKEAYEGAEATYDMYNDIFGRNSIDDKGMCIISSVHYEENFDNAFWDGRQMVYGDGDGKLFNRFTISIDVIGHELTHGVTENEAGLVYSRQPGALNESMSDVFGSLVKQKKLNQTADKADWLIGEGLLTSKVKGKALRSMKEPGTAYNDPVLGKDPQPANMKDFKLLPLSNDSGGVHINSGIPNRAFCVTAMEIGGYAWEKAGKIWYIALRDLLRPRSNFQDAANKTYQVAGAEFGAGSKEQTAVKKGWSTVGINVKAK
jgi:Zn-dependent metalloprotease